MKGELVPLLNQLRHQARMRALSDRDWAAAAGLRPETLSRLAHRSDCDLHTLNALGGVVGLRMRVVPLPEPRLPPRFGRAEEQALLDLCSSGSLDVRRWLARGPRWFMAGVAMLIARGSGPEREGLLLLAEALCPGMSSVECFGHWLETSPVKPARFLPMLDQRRRAVAPA